MARPRLGDPLPVDDLQDRYAGWRAEKVYEWEAGRQTFRLTGPDGEIRYVKITPSGVGNLPDEATKTRWAAEWVRVPAVIEYGSDGDRDWLMTAELTGVDTTRHPWRDTDPAALAAAFARGLRAFHDAIPVDECPFDLRLPAALRLASARVEAGLAHAFDAELFAGLETEDLVVCHGDYCLPNAFFEGDVVTGYLDIGDLAVADRWLDLAVALDSLSAPYNVGPGYEEVFLDAYGIARDEQKRSRYRLLYDVTH
jgi:kanamycin kinase